MSDEHPWPGDSATVARWVRASLRPDESELEIRGLDEVRIAAEVSGDDLDSLTIDASGVKLRVRAAKSARTADDTVRAYPTPPAAPEIARRSTGTARTFRLLARPVRIEGIPITIDAQIHDAPIEWRVYAQPVESGRPESRYGIELVGDGDGMRGSLVGSMRADDLSLLLSAVLRPAMRAGGIRLRRLTVSVAQDGPEGIRIEGSAGIRWKVIGASARGMVRLTVTSDGVVTVRDLRVGSGNPIVALAIRAARKPIREQIGRAYDLNESLAADGAAPRLHDVRVTAGDELAISARLG